MTLLEEILQQSYVSNYTTGRETVCGVLPATGRLRKVDANYADNNHTIMLRVMSIGAQIAILQ